MHAHLPSTSSSTTHSLNNNSFGTLLRSLTPWNISLLLILSLTINVMFMFQNFQHQMFSTTTTHYDDHTSSSSHHHMVKNDIPSLTKEDISTIAKTEASRILVNDIQVEFEKRMTSLLENTIEKNKATAVQLLPKEKQQQRQPGVHLTPCPNLDPQLFDINEVSNGIVERWKFMSFFGDLAETEKGRFYKLWPVPFRFKSMGPVFPKLCKNIESYGKGDDEKRFCVNNEMIKPGCTALSIGSANQWGFEVDIAKRTPCKIITADCTMKDPPNPPAEIKDRVTFYPLCLGATTHDNFRTYWDFLKEVKVEEPTFLKMDIEGGEWPVLLSIVHTSILAAREGKDIFPKQMAIEVHDHSNWEEVSPQSMYAFFNDVFTRAGYLMAQAVNNPFCLQCYEVLFVRVICGGEL
jgi:hypothetical protein